MPTVPKTPKNLDRPKIEVPGAIDPADLVALAKAMEGPEQAPTTRDMTPSGVDWKKLSQALGAPFDPTAVPLRKLREMREDSMIGFAIHYIIVPLARSQWHMDARDANGPNAQVASFMDAAWRQIHARYMMQHAGGVLGFGYQGLAKRFQLANPGGTWVDESGNTQSSWAEGTIAPRIWKPFVALEPERVTPRFVDTGPGEGEFDGIDLEIAPAARGKKTGLKSRSKKGNQNTIEIDVWHSLWATNDRDAVFGNLYGRPRIRHAYRFWHSYWHTYAQRDRAFERLAIPPIVAYHPDGSWIDPDNPGEKIPYQSIALSAAERLRASAIAAVPSTLASAGLDERGSQKREWEFEFLETKTNPLDKFVEALNYLDIMKLRSCWIPEQAFIESPGGSGKNVAIQMGEVFIESQALFWDDIADHINRYILPQILVINFPEFVANGGTCRIIGHGFAKEDVEFQKQIIQLIGQADPLLLGVDVREALRRVNMPMLSNEMYNAQQAAVARAQANGATPAVTGGRGKLSVVPTSPQARGGQTNGGSVPAPAAPGSLTGFSDNGGLVYSYVNPRDVIELSDTEEFLAALPSSHHFNDRAMKVLAVRMRRTWLSHYRDTYSDFADYLETFDKLEFEDKSGVTKKSAIKAANKLIREWVPSSLGEVAERTTDVVDRMLKRAARMVQKDLNLKVEFEDELDQWRDTQVSRLLTQTQDTVKDELGEFIVEHIRDGKAPREIASEVRSHFSTFPPFKADRVGRSEVRDAVNAATLLTGEVGGLKWARMSDGEEFDKECKERNGKLATIRECWKELRKTHPNCTLGFTLVPRADFSVDYIRTMPGDHSSEIAFFDEETATATIWIGATDEQIDEYLFDLGKALVDPRVLGKLKVEADA